MRRYLVFCLLAWSCGHSNPASQPHDGPVAPASPPAAAPATQPGRTPRVAAGDPLHGRVEGKTRPGECAIDEDCHVSGCSSEVCSAEEGVITTCEVEAWPQGSGASCGCVAGTCVWY